MDTGQLHGQYAVVYLCHHSNGDLAELYHHTAPPSSPRPHIDTEHSVQTRSVYSTVRSLLDQEQGGFHEVYVSSEPEKCIDRLEACANSLPTVVLVEIPQTSTPPSTDLHVKTQHPSTFAFLRALTADIHGARYQQHVMPFALLVSDSHSPDPSLDAPLATECLSLGAIDILHGPIGYEDINRLVGHVIEITRPAARLLGASMAQNLVDSVRDTEPAKLAQHHIEDLVPEQRRLVVENAMEQWAFPAHDLSMDELTYCALCMLERALSISELAPYRIPRPQLVTFLFATRRQYKHEREVHYHNWRHAVDVTQSIFVFLLDIGLCPSTGTSRKPSNPVEQLLTPLDALTLLTSAIGHDVGHPGVNNAFLVACQHPLAQLYNDKSVLENYHCAAYSQLVRRHWPALSEVPTFRPTLISNILATDMQRHFEYMGNLGDLKKRVDASQPDLSDWTDKDRDNTRELMMALLMKAADISNVARPFDISSQWAQILMREFSRQGELESELGIPTCLFGGPPKMGDVLAAAQSQKGFMSLFGYPLFSGMREVMPSACCAIRELDNNRAIWSQKVDEETRRRENEVADSSAQQQQHMTFSSIGEEEVAEATMRSRKSEPAVLPTDISQRPTTPINRTPVIDESTVVANHAGGAVRQHMSTGVAPTEGHRSSAPFLTPNVLLSPLGGPSRRSSKDVALDQLQQLTAYAHQNTHTESRRGSADAGVHLQRSYPSSRRGSKDESLTTILVTSQGSPSHRRTPSTNSARKPTIAKPRPAVARDSAPSSRSHKASLATNKDSQLSTSTLPSSYMLGTESGSRGSDDEPIAAFHDPFVAAPLLTGALDAASSAEKGLMPQVTAQTSHDTTSDQNPVPGWHRSPRESRSRSRLRGLRFWRKRREASHADGGGNSSAES